MRRYVCSVCGYIYDEAKGIPERGIAAGTKWEDLPKEWVCPLCGASKAEFRMEDSQNVVKPTQPVLVTESAEDMAELSAMELSAICSNLARGCEKQYMAEEASQFKRLADSLRASYAPAKDASVKRLISLIEHDLEIGFLTANNVSKKNEDRGAQRALVWSEKVTRILRSLLIRYEAEGEAMLENTNVYVCTVCGFIFVGENPPELCPVCKVPSWKFEKVEGR